MQPIFIDMPEKPEKVYTVTAVNRISRHLLEESFPDIWVEGEISNYHHHGSGHRYFSLKDNTCQLRCAMWRSYGAALKFEPKDGLKVIANGSLTIYEQGGQYQLSVRRLLPSGMGELELAFRQLKEKLEKEGLFAPEHKRPLPLFPMRIGVITSPTGAVIHDIIRVIKRRNPKIDIVLWPSEVQGEAAAPQLAEGIRQINQYGEVDLIIIGRGGGSLEDLWAFNDERVVRAVYNSRLPVISAVGHEVDITLTDLAADYSAATPSMAAEIAAWPLGDLLLTLRENLQKMDRVVALALSDRRGRLHELLRLPELARPESMLENRYQYLDSQIRLLSLLSEKQFDTFRKRAAMDLSRLGALSPLAILARGYSVSRIGRTGRAVRSVDEVRTGDELETILGDGSIFSIIEKCHKKD